MTALNICVTDAVMKDPKLLAFNELQEGGKSEGLNLKKLADLKDDSKMFLHGSPDSFLQSMTADVGVDCKKALTMEENQLSIRDAVDIQRQAISGPDEDEETESMLTFACNRLSALLPPVVSLSFVPKDSEAWLT